MASPKQRIKKILKDEQGAAAVEYALLVALIAAVIIVIVVTFGTQAKALFTKIVDLWPD